MAPKKISKKPEEMPAQPSTEPAPEPSTEPEEMPTEPSAEPEEPDMSLDPASELREELRMMHEAVSELVTFVKDLESRLKKTAKLAVKVAKKKRGGGPRPAADGPKRETNLTKKMKITPEMGEFLGADGEASRTDIVKRVSDYSKEKKLKLDTDKRVIVLDETLASLLNMETGAQIRFCDVQKHIKHHFV